MNNRVILDFSITLQLSCLLCLFTLGLLVFFHLYLLDWQVEEQQTEPPCMEVDKKNGKETTLESL